MDQQELIPHLFRTEFSKITAVLCSHFGLTHIATAEDIASDTFLAALETWSYNGLPPNPTAWLYTVAKNKTRTLLNRDKLFAGKVASAVRHASPTFEDQDIDLSEENIRDSQLRMLFAICHPVLPPGAQIGMALRILCGFGIDEIATALLLSKETVNKRMVRAKEKLRTENVDISFPGPHEVVARQERVLTTLYLLFNEGYYSESHDAVLREDLCLEAMRLTYLLVANDATNTTAANALLALMCFHASRFEARRNASGEPVLYDDQDETLWNNELVSRGMHFLNRSARGSQLSRYHLEASIAWWHTQKAEPEKWESILQLYNQLLQLHYTPIAALNRTYALAKANGKEAAIKEAEKLELHQNHYYYTLLGELYCGVDNGRALQHFETALALATTRTDQETISRRIARLSTHHLPGALGKQ